MHNLECLPGVLLANTDKNKIMKDSFSRKCHIDNLRKIHFKNRKKNPYTRFSHIKIFHWRHSNNRCWIDSISPMGNCRDMKHRIIIYGRIKSCMITKRPFRTQLSWMDKDFDDKVTLSRHFKGHREAFDKINRTLAGKSCK